MNRLIIVMGLIISAIAVGAQTPGTTNWTVTTGAPLTSGPAVGTNGMIYVGGYGIAPVGGALYSFTPGGATNWVCYTDSGDPLTSPAIGTNGVIYVGTKQGKIYSFSSDGTTNWVSNIIQTLATSAAPAIGTNNHLYVAAGVGPSYLYSLNLFNNTTNWIRSLSTLAYRNMSPIIGPDGNIIVSAIGTVRSFSPEGMTNWNWQNPTGGNNWNYGAAIGSNGTVFIGSSDSNLYSISAGGATNWFSRAYGALTACPVIGTGGVIYAAAWDGSLYAFTSDGRTNWIAQTLNGKPIQATPVIGSDGTIYVACADSNLYAFTSGGATSWVDRLNGAAVAGSQLAMGANGAIYVGGDDSKVYSVQGTGTLANTVWPKFQHDMKNTGHMSPLIPQGLSATKGTATTQVGLTWSNAVAATSYEVWWSTDTNSGAAVFLGETTTAAYNDTSATPGILYYYWVKGKNHAGVSEFSANDSGWRGLSAPASVVASDGTSTGWVEVTWSTADGATSYEVYRGPTNNASSATLLTETLGSSYNDTNAVPAQLYYYFVKSKSAQGSSAFSSGDRGWRATYNSPFVHDGGATDINVTTNLTLLFTWGNFLTQTINHYEVAIGTSASSVTNVLGWTDVSLYVTSYTWSASMTPGVSYYCSVRGVCPGGVVLIGPTTSDGITCVGDRLAPVYRLYSYGAPESTYEHLFTTNETEKDVLDSWVSWQYELIAWYAFLAQEGNSVPLYRLYCPTWRQHHYTTDVTEYVYLNDVDPSWDGEGTQYYVMQSRVPGSVAVYRFYHSGLVMHHFTIDEVERDAIIANPSWGYAYETIAYYCFASIP